MRSMPPAGLAVLDGADATYAVAYQPWWAVRAHLSVLAGASGQALACYDRAIALCPDLAARAFLAKKKANLLSS